MHGKVLRHILWSPLYFALRGGGVGRCCWDRKALRFFSFNNIETSRVCMQISDAFISHRETRPFAVLLHSAECALACADI
jgi:hypothetical protein